MVVQLAGETSQVRISWSSVLYVTALFQLIYCLSMSIIPSNYGNIA